ncbi:MAG: response regulator [Candidatus Sulfotelmatobacter sp.]
MQSKCLLCVDDDSDTLTARKLLLEASGYAVMTAPSGQAALDLLAAGATVHLVLLDYLMPGMKGDELADKLRERHPALPLVVVSAVGQLPQNLVNVADATVHKGHDPEFLLSTLDAILHKPEKRGSSDQPVAQKTILCVEDEELELKLRKTLFESAGYRVLEAKSASAAMDAFRSSPVDAVVMDYWLSGHGGNGTALAEEMKRMQPRIPIIMLSGFTSLPGEGVIVDAWLLKAEADPENLVNEVQRLIELRSSN